MEDIEESRQRGMETARTGRMQDRLEKLRSSPWIYDVTPSPGFTRIASTYHRRFNKGEFTLTDSTITIHYSKPPLIVRPIEEFDNFDGPAFDFIETAIKEVKEELKNSH